jgi:hypothetical protein
MVDPVIKGNFFMIIFIGALTTIQLAFIDLLDNSLKIEEGILFNKFYFSAA